ncbi:MAG: hypothetical protein DRN16_02385 [Thermoplasmata archaeon]|nr:MAG: hypothetical protein DRN16_02385 [Thermoplasmata archaeon]
MTVLCLKKHNLPDHVQKSLDNILHQLERYGRAFSTNAYAVRYLSYCFQKPRNDKLIHIGWDRRGRKSIIVLSPSVCLVRISENKVKLVPTEKVKNILNNLAGNARGVRK